MRSCSGFLTRFVGFSMLALVLGLSAPASLQAQVTRADSAAVLLTAGQRFQDDGRWEVAEAIFHYILERYGDTPAAAPARMALEAAPGEGSTLSAQVELMVWATTFGAWVGVAIPTTLGSDGAEAYGAGLLLGAPAGFLGARAYSKSRSLSPGQVRAITFGSLWGTWQGYALLELLGIGEEERCDFDFCYTDDPSGETIVGSLLIGGLAGVVGGALIARKPIPSGTATAVNFGALWGTWFGLAGGVLADLDGNDLLASTVILGNAGLIGTALMAPKWEMSRNRARLVSIAGVVGGIAGAGLDLIAQPDNEKVAIGIPLAGSIIGLVAGASLTKDMDRPRGLDPSSLNDLAETLDGGSSLLNFRGKQFSLGIPAPYPTLVPVETNRGFSFKPALGFTILDSRF